MDSFGAEVDEIREEDADCDEELVTTMLISGLL